MKRIGEIWEESGRPLKLKVRWYGWGHRHRFFEIHGFDEKSQRFFGVLENGEKITFSSSSQHWKVYELGDENHARAV